MSCVVVSRSKFGSDLLPGAAISVVPELLSVTDLGLLVEEIMLIADKELRAIQIREKNPFGKM